MQDFPRRKFNLCRLNFPIHIKKKNEKRKKEISVNHSFNSIEKKFRDNAFIDSDKSDCRNAGS